MIVGSSSDWAEKGQQLKDELLFPVDEDTDVVQPYHGRLRPSKSYGGREKGP